MRDTDMNTGSSQAHGDAFSVVHLSRLHKDVLVLREYLRSALLADSPQMEMLVYTHFYQLYKDFYLPFYMARANVSSRSSSDAGGAPLPDARPAATPEARFVFSTYTQDVLAACVYLLRPASLPDTYSVPRTPPACEEADNDANASNLYVSAKQRRFCGLVFMYTCWSSAALPVHLVLRALYPLLDAGVSGSPVATTAMVKQTTPPPRGPERTGHTENHIAANLFAQERFASQRRLLSETLTGLVLSRASGVRALFCVLLLNDRVESDMTREAAQLLVQLLTSPALTLWRQQHPSQPVANCIHASASEAEECAVEAVVIHVTTTLSKEEQLRLLAPQLLALLEEHADTTTAVSSSGTAARPRFLDRLDALHMRLPAETLEQRLHLGITMLLNALLRLAPRGSRDFVHLYRQAFYTNKYVLTPGFGCLSLRRDTSVDEESTIAALLRLKSLAKGVSLGAGSEALTRVLSPTAAGILNLCALPFARGSREGGAAQLFSPLLQSALCSLLTELLSNPSLYDLCAHTLVSACGEAHPYSYVVRDVVQPRLCYAREVCERAHLVAGLQWLLLDFAATTPGFVHACVNVMVGQCQVELFATGMETAALSPVPELTETTFSRMTAASTANALSGVVDTSPLVVVLERLALEATPEALFGFQKASLASTLELFGGILGLSGVLCRWALGMMEHLLSVANFKAYLDKRDTPAELSKKLARLQKCCRNILASLTPSNTSTQRGWASYSVVAEDDAILSLATRVRHALNACLEFIAERLTFSEAVAHHLRDKDDKQGEAIIAVRAQWQQLCEQLQSALDCRAAVDVVLTLAVLAQSVDDVVWDVTDPQPLYEITQRVLQLLLRVLFVTDDVGAALRAIHCVTWLGMYRFDSKDSTCVADVIWAVLVEDNPPPWLDASVECKKAKQSEMSARLCRLRVRVLDILLSWTDYDEDGRTLRNVDDSMRRTHHTSLYDVLVSLCQSRQGAFVQVAALHFVGAYTLAMQPRVSISAICDLCCDVFRLSQHEMAKAACAAALGKVVVFLCQDTDANAVVLANSEIETVQRLASAMSSYRGRPLHAGNTTMSVSATDATAEVDLHDAVIQQHGREMLAILRSTFPGFGQ